MNELYERCLNQFPGWLRALSADAVELSAALSAEGVPDPARRLVAGALNYLFKSLDLIPDGIEDLGYLDDAFVLRVAAAQILRDVPAARGVAPVLSRLANDTKVIAELLGKDFTRLEAYVKTLPRSSARGRTVDEIVKDAAATSAFQHEVSAWAASYETPSFSRDEKNLVKLQSFLGAKLPV